MSQKHTSNLKIKKNYHAYALENQKEQKRIKKKKKRQHYCLEEKKNGKNTILISIF